MYYQNYEDYMRQVLGYPVNDPNIYETYDYRNVPNYTDTYLSRNQSNYISTNLSEEEIRSFYPDIYHLVNPMVCKVCETNTQPVTSELIEKMTDEVYMAIEDTDTVVNVRVETPKPEEITNSKKENSTRSENSSVRDSSTRSNIHKESSSRILTPKEEIRRDRSKSERTSISKENLTVNKSIDMEKQENRETREVSINETRQSNSILRDLIKILILNQIFGGNRPPVRPPRPPFPGGPGMPPPRPPFPGPRPPMGPGPVRPPIQPREENYSDYLKF